MPTAYTAKLHDGQPQTLREFILSCARGMGATSHQRDEDPSAPPRHREAVLTSHYDESLALARARLAEAQAWTRDEAAAAANADHAKELEACREIRRIAGERRERYEDMLDKVQEWVPPTSEHQALKDFMIKQLESSIRFDCAGGYEPGLKTAAQYQADAIRKAKHDIEFYTRERGDELARVADANRWIDDLYASLPEDGAS